MSVKVTFDFVAGQIVVEGTEGDLLKLAQEAKSLAPTLSEIRVFTQKPQARAGGLESPHVPESGIRKLSIREFAKSLPLSNTYERIAAIAYHAIKTDHKPYFSVKQMDDWFGLCGFKKPKMMAVALSDAKRKYEYVENKGRDQWTITTGGENVIIDLLEKKS